MRAHLAETEVGIQIDIVFGDALEPPAERRRLASFLARIGSQGNLVASLRAAFTRRGTALELAVLDAWDVGAGRAMDRQEPPGRVSAKSSGYSRPVPPSLRGAAPIAAGRLVRRRQGQYTGRVSARTIRPPAMPPTIDRAKLRAWLRRLGDEYMFYVLDEAIEVMTPEQLAHATAKYVRPEALQVDPNPPPPRSLLGDVHAFDDRARDGGYYQGFQVNSRNCNQLSLGTRAFIADFGRLMDRCVAEAEFAGRVDTAASFAVLFELLRHIDECCDDVVFFADEGGAWQIPVNWRTVFPAWFRCLAEVASPEEYADRVVVAVEDFEHYHWDRNIEAAALAANPEQHEALLARAAKPRRRR